LESIFSVEQYASLLKALSGHSGKKKTHYFHQNKLTNTSSLNFNNLISANVSYSNLNFSKTHRRSDPIFWLYENSNTQSRCRLQNRKSQHNQSIERFCIFNACNELSYFSVGNIERWERVVTYEKRKEEKSGAGGRGVRRRGLEGRS